jgi:hypothetical protein
VRTTAVKAGNLAATLSGVVPFFALVATSETKASTADASKRLLKKAKAGLGSNTPKNGGDIDRGEARSRHYQDNGGITEVTGDLASTGYGSSFLLEDGHGCGVASSSAISIATVNASETGVSNNIDLSTSTANVGIGKAGAVEIHGTSISLAGGLADGGCGGSFSVRTGTGTESSSGSVSGASDAKGDIRLETGVAVKGDSGDIRLHTGEGTQGHGGDIDVLVGVGDTGNGGNVLLIAGETTVADEAAGGDVCISSGLGSSANGPGDQVHITGGDEARGADKTTDHGASISLAFAFAAMTSATSTLQVKSPSLATLACLAPAGSNSRVQRSPLGTLDTYRSVKLCDSYDDN